MKATRRGTTKSCVQRPSQSAQKGHCGEQVLPGDFDLFQDLRSVSVDREENLADDPVLGLLGVGGQHTHRVLLHCNGGGGGRGVKASCVESVRKEYTEPNRVYLLCPLTLIASPAGAPAWDPSGGLGPCCPYSRVPGKGWGAH